MTSERIGRYELRGELGRGGMATVYRAYDPGFGREVAVKVLPRELLHDPSFRARFEREARIIAALEHPAIVPVYDYGEESGQPYIVMRLMTGGSLSDRLRGGALALAEAVRILSALAPALDRAHAKGIIHRDLKPGNILFDGDDNPYLSDFGIARLAEAKGAMTGTAIVGTPAYMSPEQAQGNKDLDSRSDIYALGTIVFQMLTGQLPFDADTPMGLVVKHITDPVPSIRQVRPDLPPTAEHLIGRAMAKQREARHESAAQLAAELAALQTGAPPPPAPPARAGGLAMTQIEAPPGAFPQMTGQPPATGAAPRPAYNPTALVTGAAPPGGIPASVVVPAPPAARRSSRSCLLVGGLLALGAVVLVVLGLVVLGGLSLAGLGLGSATVTPTEGGGAATERPTPGQDAAEVVYRDDFGNAATGWDDGQANNGQVGYRSGAYAIEVLEQNWLIWGVANAGPLADVRITVEARNVGQAQDSAFGVVCNYQDEDNYYQLGMGPDGYYAIVRTLDGESTVLTNDENNWILSDAIALNAEQYTIEATCGAGGRLSLAVDGVEIASVTDDALTEGDVGLFARTFEQTPAEVRFDDFVVEGGG
jgi:serine/threonine-protein kinase